MKNKHILSRKKVVKAFAVYVVVAVILLIGTGTCMFVAGRKSVQPEPTPTVYTPEQLLTEANKLRAKKDVPPLKLDKRLNLSAQFKADDMKEYGYFAHVNPITSKDGYTYAFDTTGRVCKFASEELHSTWFGNSPFSQTGWPSSKPHYDSIVKPEQDLAGFGYAELGGKSYYVMHMCDLR